MDEIPPSFTSLEADGGDSVYSYFLEEVLGLHSYRMTEHEYSEALTGLPAVDKETGHHNSHLVVKAKIVKLKKRLLSS